MNKKSERLKFIIELAARQELESLQSLGQSNKKLLEQQTQLEQLTQYRLEKQQEFANQQACGLAIMQLMELRAFADKLDQAIIAQQNVVANLEQDLMRIRINWQENHQRTKNLEKISDLAKNQELKIAIKHEQTELDTRASRSARKDGA